MQSYKLWPSQWEDRKDQGNAEYPDMALGQREGQEGGYNKPFVLGL